MIDFGLRHIMAIVNITPDSFYEGSRTFDREAIQRRVRGVVDEGATIIDIGGYSSRPGADDISLEEEWRRVSLGFEVVREVAPEVAVSIDTFRSEVVRRAAESYGQFIVNDITGGEADPKIIEVAATHSLPYIAMHMRGTPETMQSMTDYGDVVEDVVARLAECADRLRGAGVEHIILDPGFGFAKSVEQNYELLASLSRLCELGSSVLAGLSRKSMIYKVLEVDPQDALAGTIALNWEALRQGASILRVHDVREATETLKLYEKYMEVQR